MLVYLTWRRKTYKAGIGRDAASASGFALAGGGEPAGDVIKVGSKADGNDDIIGSKDKAVRRRNQKWTAKDRDQTDSRRPGQLRHLFAGGGAPVSDRQPFNAGGAQAQVPLQCQQIALNGFEFQGADLGINLDERLFEQMDAVGGLVQGTFDLGG